MAGPTAGHAAAWKFRARIQKLIAAQFHYGKDLPVRLKLYSALIGCLIVTLLVAFADYLPNLSRDVLAPGFLMGSFLIDKLHNWPFFIFGFLFNCVLHSVLVYLVIKLVYLVINAAEKDFRER